MATRTVEIWGSILPKMSLIIIIKALPLPLRGWRLFCWLQLLVSYYELLHLLPHFLGPGYCLLPLLPFPPLDWAGPAPVLPVSPGPPASAALVCGFETKSPLYIYIYILPGCSSVLRAAMVSPSSLSLPGLLVVPRTEEGQSWPREGGGDKNKLPVRCLTANLEKEGAGGGGMAPSSDGSAPTPPSLWESFWRLCLLFQTVSSSRAGTHALCLGVVSVWHRKASIKV